jgi:AcrR family transcriptional regulator
MRNASAKLAPPTNRFERRRARTRRDLLTAATRALARRGLHATTIADIAAAADVGVGTFYLYFSTKEALFRAVVEDAVARLKAAVEQARASAPDAVGRMRAANAAFCRFAGTNREVFRIVFGPGAAYTDVVRRAQAHFAADVEETLRDGIAAGEFAKLPTPIAAQAVIGIATQVLSWWTEHPSVPITTLEETMTTLVLRGLTGAAPKGD